MGEEPTYIFLRIPIPRVWLSTNRPRNDLCSSEFQSSSSTPPPAKGEMVALCCHCCHRDLRALASRRTGSTAGALRRPRSCFVAHPLLSFFAPLFHTYQHGQASSGPGFCIIFAGSCGQTNLSDCLTTAQVSHLSFSAIFIMGQSVHTSAALTLRSTSQTSNMMDFQNFLRKMVNLQPRDVVGNEDLRNQTVDESANYIVSWFWRANGVTMEEDGVDDARTVHSQGV